MGLFGKTNQPTEAPKYQQPLGMPKRYLCTATYNTGSSSRYLIRELTSQMTGQGLKDEVIKLFLKDLEATVTAQNKEGETEEERRQRRKFLYLSGKLEDLVIDELKQTDLRKR
jgi:hypothetical protein